jgi:hypothetical protein
MTNSKRKRRNAEQIVKCLAEGESMLAAGKPTAEVYQKLGMIKQRLFCKFSGDRLLS